MTFKIKKIFLTKALIFSVVVFLLAVSICFAQINLSPKKIEIFVAPAIFNLDFEKGQIYSGKIILQNKNNFVLPIKTRFSNFDAKDELGEINYKEGMGTDWFFPERTDFALKPNERRVVAFKIKIPEHVPRGGYYVNWIFEPQLTVSDNTKTAVVARPNILFLISVGKRGKANFQIVETEIPSGARYSFLEKIFKKRIILNNASFPFIFRVQNNDIYHIKPQGILEVLREEKSVGKVNIKKTTILPKKIRRISVDFKPSSDFLSNFCFGKRKVVLTLKASGLTQKSEKEVFILPWKGILLIKILLILILLYFIIIKQRKKKRRKVRPVKSFTKSKRKSPILFNGVKKKKTNENIERSKKH